MIASSTCLADRPVEGRLRISCIRFCVRMPRDGGVTGRLAGVLQSRNLAGVSQGDKTEQMSAGRRC